MNQKILEAKESIVNEVAEKVTNSGSVTVVEYHGLSVAEITNLRRDLRNVDAEMVVLKNTMVSRAAEKAGCAGGVHPDPRRLCPGSAVQWAAAAQGRCFRGYGISPFPAGNRQGQHRRDQRAAGGTLLL